MVVYHLTDTDVRVDGSFGPVARPAVFATRRLPDLACHPVPALFRRGPGVRASLAAYG